MSPTNKISKKRKRRITDDDEDETKVQQASDPVPGPFDMDELPFAFPSLSLDPPSPPRYPAGTSGLNRSSTMPTIPEELRKQAPTDDTDLQMLVELLHKQIPNVGPNFEAAPPPQLPLAVFEPNSVPTIPTYGPPTPLNPLQNEMHGRAPYYLFPEHVRRSGTRSQIRNEWSKAYVTQPSFPAQSVGASPRPPPSSPNVFEDLRIGSSSPQRPWNETLVDPSGSCPFSFPNDCSSPQVIIPLPRRPLAPASDRPATSDTEMPDADGFGAFPKRPRK